jgi:hypothetical protein
MWKKCCGFSNTRGLLDNSITICGVESPWLSRDYRFDQARDLEFDGPINKILKRGVMWPALAQKCLSSQEYRRTLLDKRSLGFFRVCRLHQFGAVLLLQRVAFFHSHYLYLV